MNGSGVGHLDLRPGVAPAWARPELSRSAAPCRRAPSLPACWRPSSRRSRHAAPSRSPARSRRSARWGRASSRPRRSPRRGRMRSPSASARPRARGGSSDRAEIEHVSRLGDLLAQRLDLRLLLEELDDVARNLEQRGAEPLLVFGAQRLASAPRGDGERGQRRELAGEGLGRGDADLGTGEDRAARCRLARDRAFRRR